MGAGWLSLIPARLLELPADGWELGRARRLSGVVMVADVCGFTAMSESVARSGPDGTERLSRAINELFTPVVALVHEHGGEVALFVGDAVVAVFPDSAAARACAAAVHRSASLEMSIGLAAGELAMTVVGVPGMRLEHVLTGRALARAARAERRAGRLRTVDDGPALHGSWAAGARLADDVVRPFVHPSVAARLDAGRERLLAEHRRVTSLFCRLPDEPGAARLQSMVAGALEVLAHFGGALLQVEAVDKGSTLKATFGAPVAHEDDERRATACARALLARPELAQAAIGISTGTVFCGLIGSDARHEYTVLGDAVNVAARLMPAARPGQILATEATRERAADWEWREVGPLALRGRAGSVAAFEPVARRRAPPRGRGPLVGRERELETALGVLERALAGQGALLTISGEAGIGKSHLLDALVAAARERGVTVLRGAGRPYGRDFAYGAWRDAARELVPDREAAFAPLLGLAPPTTGLSPQLAAEALRELTVERLRARTPLLLAFEDHQWLDGPSRELLARIARELPALRALLAVTVRSGESRATEALPGGVTLPLGPLAPQAVARLVRAPPELTGAIVERAGGNPLFAEELASLAHEHAATALPDSLRAVVTARLDTLAEDERATLRLASVIGPRFAPEWLWGSDPGLGGADGVERALAGLARVDLVRPDGARHVFRHAVTREVAYDTLALAARQHLHEAVARHIERTHDLDGLEALELLAHHYARTADTAKQRVYLRRAGDGARAAFANDAAIRHYRRLVALLDGDDALEAMLDLGGVLQLTGAWAEAEALYREALAHAASEPAAARARGALGGLLAFTGAYPDAVARLEEARASFASLGDGPALAGVLERLAHTYFQQGDNAGATARAQEHARLARELGDGAGESTAINTLGLVLWHRGELEPARRRLEAALALAEDSGHRVGVVHLLNDLAGVLVALGRPEEAIERLGEASAQARAIGYRRFEGAVLGNAAQLLLDAGNDRAALACAGASLQIAASLGDRLPVLHNATVIAAIRRRQGDPGSAEALLERIAGAARAADNRRYLAEARLHQARARLDLGRPVEAEQAAAEALAIARAIGQSAFAAEATALLTGTEEPAPAGRPSLDFKPFLAADGAPPDAALLVRRAELAVDALNPSNDVVPAVGPA